MTTASLSSPAPKAANLDRTNTPSPTPRRRGFGSLRRLGPSSPGELSRLSPRSYFSRSVTYPQTPTNTSQPNSPQGQAANDSSRSKLTTRETSSPSTQETRQEARISETSLTTSPAAHDSVVESSEMARHGLSRNQRGGSTESIQNSEPPRLTTVGEDAGNDIGDPSNAQPNGIAQDVTEEKSRPPTIRFLPHQELRHGRPSLSFVPIVRTLPSESSIIRVGRYSEREGIPVSNPAGPSDAPVGFKSKVVSRKHCEFSFVNGSWQIKDVSSSSGTFLNHIRLSQPNTESRLYPVKDGDIVQLGIDFRGGEEMIFRCVKIRIECNRSWQKRPNNFKYVNLYTLYNLPNAYYCSMNRHAQLQKLGKGDGKVDENKGECSICLGDVAVSLLPAISRRQTHSLKPCQSLFIAACAHVWHYKCIRRMLMGSSYPQFTCPNCRAITDLEAELDVDDDGEWEEHVEEPSKPAAPQPPNPLQNQHDTAHAGGAARAYVEAGDVDLNNIQIESNVGQTAPAPSPGANGLASPWQPSIAAASPGPVPANGIDIPRPHIPSPLANVVSNNPDEPLRVPTPTSADIIAGEGPLTPRNDAGPFVFDGSAGRVGRSTTSAMDESE